MLRAPLSPKSPLFPKTSSANFPLCTFAKILGKWAQSIWGAPLGHLWYPLPSNTHLPHCPFANIWGKGAQGTCGTPLGHLRYPFPPKVQVAHLPCANIWENEHRAFGVPFRELGVAYSFPPNAHFSRCPFAPTINFFQQPICPKSPFISMLICPEYFFAICLCAPVPISLKCPFTLNSPYLQMPICHSAHHFPKSPLAPVPICSKCPILRDPNVWDPYCLIRSHAVLKTVSCDSIQRNAVLYKRFLAVPHGLMSGSMWYPLVP